MRFLLLLLLPLFVVARDIPELTGPVIDEVGVLKREQRWQLSSLLKDVNQKHGVQLQVFIARDMDGDAIENFSIRAVDKWKLGSASGDKGLLFVLAMAEKKVRIEVGQGLEGEVTDAQAGMLIESLTPYFRRGDFSTGVLVGVNGLLGLAGVQNEGTPVGMKKKAKGKPIGGFAIFLIFIFIVFEILTRRGRHGAFYLGGGPNIRIGGGGGFSGGGGWSGGGGGFSGGGASGGW